MAAAKEGIVAENITSWLPLIPIPMVPTQAKKEAIINGCRDFCQHAHLWDNQAITAINVVDGTHTYTLASADGDICVIDYVQVDGAPINPVSINELNKKATDWKALTSPRSSMYLLGMADEIRLVYEPSEDIAGGLEVWVCLKPLETATSVEDFLWRDYKKAIAYFAMSEIYSLPGMPWTDFKQSIIFEEMYEAKRFQAMSKKFTGRTLMEMGASDNSTFFA